MDGPFLKNANQKYTLKLFVAFYLNGPCSLLPLTGISRFPAKVVFNNYHLIKDFFKWANSRPLFDFSSFYFYNYSLNLNTKNWRKRRWCAWYLNSGRSVTSLGDFWRPMATKFSFKTSPNVLWPLQMCKFPTVQNSSSCLQGIPRIQACINTAEYSR